MNEHASGKTEAFGWAWVALCAALGVHIVDEACTDFLSVYNPTALEIRRSFPFLPAPTFEFREWLFGLIAVNSILFSLSPLAFRNHRFARCLSYPFLAMMFANGIGHIAGTIAGRTAKSVRFERPMPGFWSSPAMLAASAYLAYELSRSK